MSTKKPVNKNKRPTGPKPRPRHKADIWGLHAADAAWRNRERTIKALYITEHALKPFETVMDEAGDLARPAPTIMSKNDMDRMLPGAVHQGIAIDAAPLPEIFVNDLIIKAAHKDKALIVMLDQVTDPHNVGAIMRSACAFGADGMVMQRKHSPELTGALAKTATGAVEHLPAAYEINLADALDTLKSKGFTAIGLDEHETNTLAAIEKPAKAVIVLGAEGKGLRPKVREHCDIIAALPTSGPIKSLNVSNAAAIAFYEMNK